MRRKAAESLEGRVETGGKRWQEGESYVQFQSRTEQGARGGGQRS